MTALAVAFYVACCWLILLAIRDMRADGRNRRRRTSWLARHQRDVRARQIESERRDSARVGWRR